MARVSDRLSDDVTLYQVFHRHSSQAKRLNKILDDTRRIFKDTRSASCISEYNIITNELTLSEDELIEPLTRLVAGLVVVSLSPAVRAAVVNQLLKAEVLPTTPLTTDTTPPTTDRTTDRTPPTTDRTPPTTDSLVTNELQPVHSTSVDRLSEWRTLIIHDTDCVSLPATLAVSTASPPVSPAFPVGESCPTEHKVTTQSTFSLPEPVKYWFNKLPLNVLKMDMTSNFCTLDVLMCHPLLSSGAKLIVCGGSNINKSFQQCVRHIVPVVIFAVSGSCASDEELKLLNCIQEFDNNISIMFVQMDVESPATANKSNFRRQLSELNFLAVNQSLDDVDELSVNSVCADTVCGDTVRSDTVQADTMCTDTVQADTMRGDSVRSTTAIFDICEELNDEFNVHFAVFAKSALQQRMLAAVELLHTVHRRCLDSIIATTFDAASDIACSPARLKFIRDKEKVLNEELLVVAVKKQLEIRKIIVETIAGEKQNVLQLASNYQFTEEDDRSGSSRLSVDVKDCVSQIQKLVLCHLNAVIAAKLFGLVDALRSSCIDVLVRCLESLERKTADNWESLETSVALNEILRTTYNVELTVFSRQSPVRTLLEKMKQLMYNMRHSTSQLNDDWKKNVASNTLSAFTDSRCKRLSKDICCQIEDRLRVAHSNFEQSMNRLEKRHNGRLQQTQQNSLNLRKKFAPRVARLVLESRSFRDLVLHGKPVLGVELGRGQYGTVYYCDLWAGFENCAVKSVTPPDDRHFNDLALEFHYTTNIPEHERIVTLRGSVIDYKHGIDNRRKFPAVLLIMDRFQSDLFTAIQRGMAWVNRLQVTIDVAEGIRYLHSLGLVHRDIKLNNVLLDFNNRGKLADFGFCKPAAMMSGSVVGTPLHMAPELITCQYDRSVDVYAFGMLFWFVCSGSVLYPQNFQGCDSVHQFFELVKNGLRPERPCDGDCDDECWILMQKCWNADARLRPHIGELEQSLRVIYEQFVTQNTAGINSLVSNSVSTSDPSSRLATFSVYQDSLFF